PRCLPPSPFPPRGAGTPPRSPRRPRPAGRPAPASQIAASVMAAILAVAGLLLDAAPSWSPGDASTIREGVHEGADFLIGMPARWNGGLVMFAHGYEGESPGKGGARGDPSASYLTARGYAWAASGYRSMGYRPDWFMADTLALRQRFIQEFGRPRWTVIHGQ